MRMHMTTDTGFVMGMNMFVSVSGMGVFVNVELQLEGLE